MNIEKNYNLDSVCSLGKPQRETTNLGWHGETTYTGEDLGRTLTSNKYSEEWYLLSESDI